MSEQVKQHVKFRRLAALLKSQGFVAQTIKGSHHLFVHEQTGVTLMLPVHRGEVGAAFIAAVGRTLDENGLMDRHAFDAALRNGEARRDRTRRQGAVA